MREILYAVLGFAGSIAFVVLMLMALAVVPTLGFKHPIWRWSEWR